MDEQPIDESGADAAATGPIPIGAELRAAREAQGLSLDDIAQATRISTRHLTSIETADWAALPAATYAIGFAKNYATALGLDREQVAERLRAEMGGHAAPPTPSFADIEPIDERRTMPGWLVWGGILAALIVAGLLAWLNSRAQVAPAEPVAAEAKAPPPAAATPAPAPAPAAPTGAVRLTARDAVWVDVRDGATRLKFGDMKAGEPLDIPASASAPVITTGRPEVLTVTVGGKEVAPLGPPAKLVSKKPLTAAALTGAGGAATPAGAPAAPAPASVPTATLTTPPAPQR